MSTKRIQVKPSRKKGESKVEINLIDELTIYSIEDIKDDITEAVNKYEIIEIIGKSIKNMDLTFVQLIKSVQKTAEKTKKTLILDIELNEEQNVLFNNTDITRIIK